MLINLRNALMTGKRTPTAKDYVQDGLVAMWDGIENAGWGVHDPDATTWVDLIGTRHATLSGSYSWGANYWDVQSVSGRGLAEWDGTNLPASQTWEILIHPVEALFYGRILAEGQGVASPCIRRESSDIIHMYGYGLDNGATINRYNNRLLHLHTIVHPSGMDMDYYIDGRRVWTKSATQDSRGATHGYFANNASYGRGLDARYFSVRLYSRALAAAEIAANYAIDKARFGLP